MNKVDELRKALTQRGAKVKIHRTSGLSLGALHKIQDGTNVPLDTTRRLIARALGLPEDYFLEPDPNANLTARRIVIELDIPQDLRLDDGRMDQIRAAMVDAGNHIIGIIKKLDTAGQGRSDGEHSTKSS